MEKLVTLILFLLVFVLGIAIGQKSMKHKFVETKCAQYNPVSGNFEILHKDEQ